MGKRGLKASKPHMAHIRILGYHRFKRRVASIISKDTIGKLYSCNFTPEKDGVFIGTE